MIKTLLSGSLNGLRNSICKFLMLGLFSLSQYVFSQTVVIGTATTSGSSVVSSQITGNFNGSRSVHVVRKSSLAAAGVLSGSTIIEWGYHKTSTSELCGSNQWELKVYLKNVGTAAVVGSLFANLGNGATLIRQEIVDQDKIPVQAGYWMWQVQDHFEYTGNDILCIVEWTPLQSVYNNITRPMTWEHAPGASAITVEPSSAIETTATAVAAAGYSTRISFVNALFPGTTVSGGTIQASIISANAGAPFSLIALNQSSGVDMEYQWQKSPAGLNQWTNIGEAMVFPSLPIVMQDTPTDYRMQSTCVTTGQSAMSNVISIGQKANVIFTDPELKTVFVRAAQFSPNFIKNLAGTTFGPDVDNDGEIQLTEALNIGSIYFVSPPTFTTNLVGIESLLNLKSLVLSNEPNIPNPTIPSLPNLETLGFGSSALENITFGDLPQLKYVGLTNNNLTSIDLTNMPLLRSLSLDDNLFTTFTIPNNDTFNQLKITNNLLTELTAVSGADFDYLDCSNNQLTTLNVVSAREPMGQIKCNNNQLTSFTFSFVQGVATVECNNNQLQSLDFSNYTIQSLDCSNNDLQTLFIRNNFNEFDLNFAGNPNLAYICQDYAQVQEVKDLAIVQGYPNLNVNDYCSFEPVGDWYIIGANSRYSATGTCDVNSVVYPYLKLKWSNVWDGGAEFLGNFYTNSLGELNDQLPFSFPSILEPELEYPEYFNVSPAPFAFDFTPAPATPISQDFCVTPNGVHNDIEARIIPLSDARPGFDATYRIILRNVGTETSSGDITLLYEDNVMDFLSADLAPSVSSFGHLGWNYSDLQPFETQTIYLSFNLNGPGSTPALNNGDILDFGIEASSGQTDVNPFNNQTTFHQSIVNSFDPNDKTCLEGNLVGLEQVGDFVHYVIRFENTGTASAINVVIKDVLDAQRFDVNSLILLNSSHPCSLRQRENSFEFIFEDINLAFSGEDAKGYILFKVKLRNNLIWGDTFSNQAGIYFDYNLPIITNNETTAIGELGNNDHETDLSIVMYPNPASDRVVISSAATIRSLELYDLQGRLLQTQFVNESNVDLNVSQRSSGIYYLKIRTEAGLSIQKLVKK